MPWHDPVMWAALVCAILAIAAIASALIHASAKLAEPVMTPTPGPQHATRGTKSAPPSPERADWIDSVQKWVDDIDADTTARQAESARADERRANYYVDLP